MPVFDITELIMRQPYSPPGLRTRTFKEIVKCLGEEIGEYYGRGEHPVLEVGSGWEVYVDERRELMPDLDDGEEYFHTIVTWKLDITDEEKAVMFALKYL